MKKILFLLLLSINSFAQIANPERGMYYHTETHSNSYNQLTQSSLINRRVNEQITLILRVFYLENFKNSPISATYLSNMQTDFDRCRNSGVKVIIRFAYNSSSSQTDASKAIVLSHISQLSSVINNNADVILCIQQGFIGSWGEGYYTTNFGNAGVLTAQNIADRNEVLQAELDNFTPFLQVRTPLFKKRLVGNTALTSAEAYTNTAKAMIGHHNDSFLSSNSEQGTYSGNNANILLERAYVAQETQFTPMGGEANEFPTSFTDNVLSDMDTYNYTYFNSVGYASGIINDWQNKGWLDEIKDRLGYKFVVNSANFSSVGNNLSVNISITNEGFARVFKQRNVFLVLRSAVTTLVQLLPTDVRTWENTVNITGSFIIPEGEYETFLYLPDNSLTAPEYAIRIARGTTWESSTGYNNLNQTVSIVAGCVSTIWNGTSWSNGLPDVNKNAIINGNCTITPSTSFKCCNLTVNAPLEIRADGYISVEKDIINNSTFVVRSTGKLIPLGESSGNITVERTVKPMKRYDYTYFSSPVQATIPFNSNWQQDYVFKFFTQNFSDIETNLNGVITLGVDGQDDDGNAWQNVVAIENMEKGRGYSAMIKSMPPLSSYPQSPTVSFTGDLNTGIVNKSIVLSANPAVDNDDYNLVGNPYSSSISATQFISDNIDNISGTLYFWTHAGTLSNSYPGLAVFNFSTQDYAYFNLSGGVASSFGGEIPSNYIASCQGFLVEAETNADLIFKPSLMALEHSNANFFRERTPKKLWLSLRTNLWLFSQQLINYNEDTSLDYDKGWDCKEETARQALTFYSFGGKEKYKIQARGEFKRTDVVELGFRTEVDETFTINLDSVAGIERVILLEYGVAKRLPYTFFSQKGEYNDRFKLVFKKKSLYLHPNPTENTLTVYYKGNVTVTDIRGTVLKLAHTVLEDRVILDTSGLTKGNYIVIAGEETEKFVK